MRFKFIALALFSASTFLITPASEAGFSCRLTEQLGDPRISNNARFWEEFGELSQRNAGDRELAELLQRHGVDDRASGRGGSSNSGGSSSSGGANGNRPGTNVPVRANVQMSQTASRELRLLQPALRNKANEFVELARGGSSQLFTQLRQNQGRWQLERLNGNQSAYHSVRLNGEYRAVFRGRDDGSIEIINFSKTATHGGGH